MTDESTYPSDPLANDVRATIVGAAAELLTSGGVEAATTRAVATAAGVQAPTIYRLFGDKGGLLDAAAERVFADYVKEKSHRKEGGDPVMDLRVGWDAHLAFGLANPSIFLLIYATNPAQPSRAAAAGVTVLRKRVRRVARLGLLRVSEVSAVDLLRAMAIGTVITLLETRSGQRGKLSDAAREAVFCAILNEQAEPVQTGAAGMAAGLHTCLDDVAVLSPGERGLLSELLQRIADGDTCRH